MPEVSQWSILILNNSHELGTQKLPLNIHSPGSASWSYKITNMACPSGELLPSKFQNLISCQGNSAIAMRQKSYYLKLIQKLKWNEQAKALNTSEA